MDEDLRLNATNCLHIESLANISERIIFILSGRLFSILRFGLGCYFCMFYSPFGILGVSLGFFFFYLL